MATIHKKCSTCGRIGSSFALFTGGKLLWYCTKCYHQQLAQRTRERSPVVVKGVNESL